jgi:hypothetical protein
MRVGIVCFCIYLLLRLLLVPPFSILPPCCYPVIALHVKPLQLLRDLLPLDIAARPISET